MSARFHRTLSPLALLTTLVAGGLGQPTPALAQLRLGEEFRVNSYTSGSQRDADVASHPDGSFIVVWGGPDQGPGSTGIFGQRYGADGNPIGGEFQVNTYTTGSQWGARAATNEDGDFVVVWTSKGQGDAVFGQLFDAGGSRVGGEFHVGTGASSFLSVRDVAMNAGGDFVVVWDRGNFSNSGRVLGRRFDASGNAIGSEFLVSPTLPDVHHQPAIAVAEGGDFVVTWTSYIGFPSYCCAEVLGRRFDASGNPLGDPFQVVWENWYQGQSDVAMSSQGEFVVVWASFYVCRFDDKDCAPTRPTSGYLGIMGQRFDAEGEKVGEDFQIAPQNFRYRGEPSVSHRSGDEFVVVWQAGAGYDIKGRVVDDLGTLLGEEFLINSYTTGSQQDAAVAAAGSGDFLVVWEGQGSSDPSGVFGQRFAGPGLTLTVDGTCPGPVTVDVSSAPPNSEVALIAAANTNGFTKGGTLCNGTELEIGEPFQLPPSFVIVDENGNGTTSLTLGTNRCHVQALALQSCETSNVAVVP